MVGSHQPFLININYHKIPLRIFLGPTYCQNMRFKICVRSRSLKMSNNKHLLLQQPFLININYHKIPLRIFLGDIRIPPWPKPLPQPKAPPHPIVKYPLLFLIPIYFGSFFCLGPLTSPNLNIRQYGLEILGYPFKSTSGGPHLQEKCRIHVK